MGIIRRGPTPGGEVMTPETYLQDLAELEQGRRGEWDSKRRAQNVPRDKHMRNVSGHHMWLSVATPQKKIERGREQGWGSNCEPHYPTGTGWCVRPGSLQSVVEFSLFPWLGIHRSFSKVNQSRHREDRAFFSLKSKSKHFKNMQSYSCTRNLSL